ncbi:MAG: hypothetical protein AB4911_10925 [Oscillochloridaceae bacterium umkhey_bin13]
MPRRDLSLPLAIIATTVVLVMFLLTTPFVGPLTAQDFNPCPPESYPTAEQLLACQQTATARTVTATPYPTPTSTNTSTATSAPPPGQGNNNQPNAPTPTPTSTVTATMLATATPGLVNALPTPTNVLVVAPPPNANGTPTPTSLFEGLETLVCQPGSEVVLEGMARPNTALLVFFNERSVGGTLSRVDGRYRAPMRIGRERAGFYLVEVRERDGLALVDQFACAVPSSTPTPTPLFGR